MIEHGIASIVAGTGRIATSKAPSPVRFTPGHFPIVEPGPVLFTRFSDSPPWDAWANQVVQASAFDTRLQAAKPEAGWTTAAETKIRKHAFSSALAQAATPDADTATQFATFDLGRFAALGQSTSRVTVADVVDALE